MLENSNINLQSFASSQKYNISATQIHTGIYASVRRINRKQHKTDCNVYHNGLIRKVFVCGTVITKYATVNS